MIVTFASKTSRILSVLVILLFSSSYGATAFDLSSIHGVYDWTSLVIGNGTTTLSDFSSGFRLFQRRDTRSDAILMSGTIAAGNDFVATLRIAGNASMMYQNSDDGQHRYSLGAVPVALEHIYWTAKVCLADTITPDCPTIGPDAANVEQQVRAVLSDKQLQLGVMTDCQPVCGNSPTVILEGRSVGLFVGEFVRDLDNSAAAVAVVPTTMISAAKRVIGNTNVAWWATCFLPLFLTFV